MKLKIIFLKSVMLFHIIILTPYALFKTLVKIIAMTPEEMVAYKEKITK